MKNLSRIIPCYAADTSGVCSALYELGGMTVVHDASGCNSTYATHDEPRWWSQQSMIYISALNELDAILGNDEKFIADVTAAAMDQQPKFIAICGSPMPMMTGFDYDSAAAEIGRRTGIRTFPLHTDGMHAYTDGASEALLAVAKAYVTQQPNRAGIGVNIMGATPLDLGLTGTAESIREWLADAGCSVVSCFAMGDTLEQLSQAASAHVSLVISQSGFAAAEYLYEAFGIPYVCGIPVGKAFSETLASELRTAAESGACAYPCTARHTDGNPAVVIGDAVIAGSIAAGLPARVICPLPHADVLIGEGDSAAYAEEDIEAELAASKPETVIADPLYRYILPRGTKLIELPHFAFSGRCFDKAIPNLITERLYETSNFR